MPSSPIRFRTARRAARVEVARSLLLTIVVFVFVFAVALGLAMESLLENGKAPDGEPPEASSPHTDRGSLQRHAEAPV